MAKTFDARQKIGSNDVRQRLGGGAGNLSNNCFCTYNMMEKPPNRVYFLSGLILKSWSLSSIRVSGQRCQREARSKGCSLQNPW